MKLGIVGRSRITKAKLNLHDCTRPQKRHNFALRPTKRDNKGIKVILLLSSQHPIIKKCQSRPGPTANIGCLSIS